tara:strand:+ start:26457 stop:26921 length:465 start_codon:yes stop_codon:yes gene_type:complete
MGVLNLGYYKNKQIKNDELYMGIAEVVALRSHDDKHQVGAVIADGNKILSYGWNGTPHGMDNNTRYNNGKTKWEVIHAEANAICKLASSNSSSKNSTLYTTISPCIECTKLILQSQINRVVYKEVYNADVNGKRVPQLQAIEFLKSNGVKVEKY